MARAGLILLDMALSFMWVWAGALSKILIYDYLGVRQYPAADVLKIVVGVTYMFFFAWLTVITGGASFNPLTVFSSAFSSGVRGFFFIVFVRIPSQVLGSIIGVMLIRRVFPQVGRGPRLNVGMHHGALTEGLLTFFIVLVSLGLKKKDPKSFFMKTWISSVCKGALHILGSDLTGGIMNPASAFGWAFARGDHITLEHLLVYWVAPIHAALLGMWTFRLFTETGKSKEPRDEQKKAKSE
ncbi:putative major intrinsic protein [Dioscorea sansibarensis]